MAKSTRPRNHPETKISPVNSGISVAIWLNSIETDDGERRFRSITVSPKRYRDKKTGEWKDAGSYAPSDLPPLVFALQKAIEFCYSHPLPGQTDEPTGQATLRQPDDDEVPY